MLAAMASFGVSAQRTVQLYCNDIESVVLRDGGPNGTVINAEGCTADEYVNVTFADALYIGLANENKTIKQVTYTGIYGWTSHATVTNDQVTLLASQVYDGTASVNITVVDPVFANLMVDDPEIITVKTNEYGNVLSVVKGENKLKLSSDGGFFLQVNNPDEYKLISLFRESDGKQYDVRNFQSCTVFGSEMKSGDSFSYVVVPISEFKAPTFTIAVDNPDAVKVSVNYVNVDMSTFTPGEPKEIEMNNSTCTVGVSPAVYGDEIYKVTLNGEPLSSYGYITARENDEIVVTADFPEVYRKININCTEPEAIKSVTMAGIEVENWKDGFEAQEGKALNISFNYSFYSIDGLDVNGVPAEAGSYTYSYSTKVYGDMDIDVKATKYPTLSATVNVNNPDAVKFTLNSSPVQLKEGANTIEFTANASNVVVQAVNKRFILNSVKITEPGGEPVEKLSYNSAYFNLSEGLVVDIDASAVPLDQKIVIYSTNASDDPAFATFNFSTYNGISIPVEKGYSIFDFNANEAPLSLSVYGPGYNDIEVQHVYVNGEAAENYYGYYLDVKNNDVVKMFFFVEPETYTASFDIEEGCDVSVVKDLIVPVADPSAGISDFQGTLVQLKNEDENAPIDVFVASADAPAALDADEDANGEKVNPDENGVYNVTLDASKKIIVRKNTSAGIESVAVKEGVPADVYNVSGVAVLRNATQEQINALPAGIYIVAGRKVVVK